MLSHLLKSTYTHVIKCSKLNNTRRYSSFWNPFQSNDVKSEPGSGSNKLEKEDRKEGNKIDSNQKPLVTMPSLFDINKTESKTYEKFIKITPELKKLLSSDCIAIQREVELANIIIGYEQANKYSIRNRAGEIIGYIAEQGDGEFGSSIKRNLLHTKRTFKADVLDPNGNLLFRVTKPLHLISSNLLISDNNERTLGEVAMDWHVYKRRYDLSSVNGLFGRVEGGFLAWEFLVLDADGNTSAIVDRNWMGIGREIVSDSGRYVVYNNIKNSKGPIPRFDGTNFPTSPFFSSATIPPVKVAEAVNQIENKVDQPKRLEKNQFTKSSKVKGEYLGTSKVSDDKSIESKWNEEPKQGSSEWWSNLNDSKSKTKESESNSLQVSESSAPQSMPTTVETGATFSDPQPFFTMNGRNLTIEERAVVLGMAILIDFDYFSRKGGNGLPLPLFIPMGGGGGAAPIPVDGVPSESIPENTIGGEEFQKGSADEFGTSNASDPEFMQDKWANNNSESSDSESGLGNAASEEGEGGIISTLWKIFGGGD